MINDTSISSNIIVRQKRCTLRIVTFCFYVQLQIFLPTTYLITYLLTYLLAWKLMVSKWLTG